MRLYTLLAISLLFPGLASALPISYTGSLDPNNPNDLYIASFTLSATSDVLIQSWGYGGTAGTPTGTNGVGQVIAAGGFDTYLTVFKGIGVGATFLASNDDGGCGPASADPVCEDSRLDLLGLGPGGYMIALGLPNNYSIAENYGSGTFGDGFIGLQGDYYDAASNQVRTSAFAFDVSSSSSSGAAVTPEPSSFWLLATGFIAMLSLLRTRQLSPKASPNY